MPATDHPPLDLQQIETEAWQFLANGSRNPENGFYTCTLGTQTALGVSLRTVVLREASPVEKTITCYSDIRADKVAQIRQQPAVSFLFWDTNRKIQLRLSGKAAIHFNDPLALQYWEHTSLSNRRSYLAITEPGSSQTKPSSGLPGELDKRAPTQQESEKGKENFAVIVTHISYMDWLFLSNSGHRRAQFVYESGQLISKEWITP